MIKNKKISDVVFAGFIILTVSIFALYTTVLSANSGGMSQQLASVSLSLPATTVTTITNTDPISYWKFDEGSGTLAADLGTSGFSGNIVGPVYTTGKYGNALSFDGTNDYVTLAGTTAYDNMGAITISAWINPASTGENGKGRILAKSAGTNLPSMGWSFYLTNEVTNGIKFAVDHTSAHLEHASVANAITLNQWQFVAVTWDGSATAANAHIYVNGNEVGYSVADNAVGTRASDIGKALYIGNNPALSRTFKGNIDDVKVYNRVLSASEITNLYSNGGNGGAVIPPPVSDTTAPSVPTNLQASVVSTSQINLSWTASTDNTAVTGYNIYRNGTKIATATSTSYSNTGLTASTTYSYTVSAYDAAGNTSAQTTAVSATTSTTPVSDTTTPSVPTNLQASVVSTSQINLSWTASTDNTAVTGYNIYRNGTKIATATSTSYSNTGLTASTTYSYTVSAYDAAGNTSAQTTAVSAKTNDNQVGTWWKPTIGTSWQIQFSGTLDQTVNATIFDIDLFDTDVSVITSLHSKGKKVVCYFSGGSSENWRPDYSQFITAVKGNKLSGWAGENWLDVRNLTVLGPIMSARMDLAKSKGCDGVDVDNMDGYTNNTGFPLTYANQITYNKYIADAAHARGLGIGLKNDLDQIKDLVSVYDWQINEECFDYNECDLLAPFIAAGKPVHNIEYNLTTSQFCSKANAMNFDSLKKNLSLDAARTPCR